LRIRYSSDGVKVAEALLTGVVAIAVEGAQPASRLKTGAKVLTWMIFSKAGQPVPPGVR
jgi:hypothetical protein